MTKRFHIKHGLFLKSANKLLTPNTFFVTEDEAQQKELLEVFGEAVEEIKSVKTKEPKSDETNTVDPNDDITLANGVGKVTSTKLAAAGITTFSGLKAAMTDKERVEEMKTLLKASYSKVMANFEEGSSSEK